MQQHFSLSTRARTRLTDRGRELGASAVEAALVLPLLFVLFFSIVQGAVTLHAGNVAQAAAQAAFEAARLYDGTAEAGLAMGQATASSAGTALSDVHIDVTVGATTVEVSVTGNAASIVPGMPVTVERSVSGPRERWVD